MVHDHGVGLRNAGNETIPLAIVFENHAGRIGFHMIRGLNEPVDVQFSEMSGSLEDLRGKFEAELTEMGLYRDEAHAMLATWRDSWFEEGLRVFYILPRAKVDTLLPISIKPAPGQLARVFVGRVELLSPKMREEIGVAMASGDTEVLGRYGRFLDAFLNEMAYRRDDPSMNERTRRFLSRSDQRIAAEAAKASCRQ